MLGSAVMEIGGAFSRSRSSVVLDVSVGVSLMVVQRCESRAGDCCGAATVLDSVTGAREIGCDQVCAVVRNR